MRGKPSSVICPDRSDESFRYISLREWYSSAMPLLQTPYRTAVLSGLLHSVGSQVASVASVAFDALKAYLVAASDTGVLLEKVLGDLRVILSANLNNSRIFCPAITTAVRLLADDDLAKNINYTASSQTIVAIIMTSCRGVKQLKSIERISGSLKL